MTLLAQQRVISTPVGALNKHDRNSRKLHSISSLTVAADVLAGFEAAIVFGCSIAAKVVYLDFHLGTSQMTSAYASLGLIASFTSFFIIRSLNLYDLSSCIRAPLQLWRLILGLGVTFLIIVTFLFMLKIGANFSRGWLSIWFALSAGGLILGRYGAYKFLSWRAAKGHFRRRVAVYGVEGLSQTISAQILENSDDFELVGLFNDKSPASTSVGQRGTNVEGDIDALIAFGQRDLYDQVILALPASETSLICNIVNKLSVLPVDIQLFPEVISLPLKIRGAGFIGDLHVLELQKRPLSERGLFLKGLMDWLVSCLAVATLLPLFLILAVAIKLDSKGPAFFRQRRHGFNHEVIRVFKFRTMSVLEDGDVIKQATAVDQRVTPIGRLLRRTSLDELPQLFNVLRGEMSLVGPRPHAIAHNEYYRGLIEHYSTRHRVRPGITGWAQVHGYRGETRNPDHMRNRVNFDIQYIDNWSLTMDLKILFMTLRMILSSRNAY
jgi:Undecaprenyl-phosphate glucose phosphotransferase